MDKINLRAVKDSKPCCSLELSDPETPYQAAERYPLDPKAWFSSASKSSLTSPSPSGEVPHAITSVWSHAVRQLSHTQTCQSVTQIKLIHSSATLWSYPLLNQLWDLLNSLQEIDCKDHNRTLKWYVIKSNFYFWYLTPRQFPTKPHPLLSSFHSRKPIRKPHTPSLSDCGKSKPYTSFGSIMEPHIFPIA